MNLKDPKRNGLQQYQLNIGIRGGGGSRGVSQEDYDDNDGNVNNNTLNRDLSRESYNSLYEAELNSRQQQQLQQQQRLSSSYGANNLAISNINGSLLRLEGAKHSIRRKGLNGQCLKGDITYQHNIYNKDSYGTYITHEQQQHVMDEDDDDDDVVINNEDVKQQDIEHEHDHDNMAITTLASNKTYKNFVLPLDIPTPPLPLSYNNNTTKRLLSSYNQHNHNHATMLQTCQCDKQTKGNNNVNQQQHHQQLNHISFIQTTPTPSHSHSHINSCTSTPASKKENLKLLHNKGSSSSSTTLSGSSSGGVGGGGVGAVSGIVNGLNFNVTEPTTTAAAQLQHHHLCQQKNLKLQQQQQHHNTHHPPHCQQLPLYDAYASQQYLPQQLPHLLSNSNNYQQNSLTLSHRRMAPTFNRLADKNYMKVSRFWFFGTKRPYNHPLPSKKVFFFIIYGFYCNLRGFYAILFTFVAAFPQFLLVCGRFNEA